MSVFHGFFVRTKCCGMFVFLQRDSMLRKVLILSLDISHYHYSDVYKHIRTSHEYVKIEILLFKV